jgi:hypothetical protein
MRSIRLGVAMLLLLAANTLAFPQSVKSWYIIAAPSFGRDSCQVVKSPDQLRDLLASNGWAKDGHLPAFDQKSTMVLLTAVDQSSKPDTLSISKDGTQAIISFTNADQRNSGVFLLAIDGQMGSKNACIAFSPAEYYQSSNQQPVIREGSSGAASFHPPVTTTTTKTTTRAQPQ